MTGRSKLALLLCIGTLLTLAALPVLPLLDRWFIAPALPPRIVSLDSRLDDNLHPEGALNVGENPNASALEGTTIKVEARWLDDGRLSVVIQRRNKEFMAQVELWIAFDPPKAPEVQARAGSMPLDSTYVWPLIHPRGSVVFSPQSSDFARIDKSGRLVMEYILEGWASGSPQKASQKIALVSAEVR